MNVETLTERATLPLARALNEGLRAAMAADETVLLMGEDIGPLGGVFRVTDRLQAEFGSARVLDTPLQFVEGAVGGIEEYATGRGQFYPAFAAGKQAEPQLALQAIDGLAQRGLSHVQANGRLVEMQLFSHRNELAQQAGFDHFCGSFICNDQ